MQSLQKSWLNGEICPTSPKHLMTGVVQLARIYFQDWTENEVREFWLDVERLLKTFIQKIGKKSYLTNPINILNDNAMFFYDPHDHFIESKVFLKKWREKLENSKLAKTQHVCISEDLLAVFILQNAAKGNMRRVLDSYSFLVDKNNRAASASQINKSVISEQNRKNAQRSRKSPLRKLIEISLKANPQKNHLGVLADLKKPSENFTLKITDEGKQKFLILSEHSNNRKALSQRTSMPNFIKMVSKVRTAIKKSP